MSKRWHIEPIACSETIVGIRDENGLSVGTVIKEDAPLIVAAPDMQEALEGALDSLDYVERNHPGLTGYGVRGERIAAARAALVKAKGE